MPRLEICPSATRVMCCYLGCGLRRFIPVLHEPPRLLHMPSSEYSSAISQLFGLAVRDTSGLGAGSELVGDYIL